MAREKRAVKIPLAGLKPSPVQSTVKWSWTHTLALVGAIIGLHEAWTLVAWLADGPHLVTEFRDRSSASWYHRAALDQRLLRAAVGQEHSGRA
jgi:hypothetical protein